MCDGNSFNITWTGVYNGTHHLWLCLPLIFDVHSSLWQHSVHLYILTITVYFNGELARRVVWTLLHVSWYIEYTVTRRLHCTKTYNKLLP